MDSTLNPRLAAIGFRIGWRPVPDARPSRNTDIERTLLDAVREIPNDARLASLVFTWIQVHGAYVIVEKLAKLSRREDGPPAWLPAVAAWAVGPCGGKWLKLARRSPEPVYLFPKAVTESAVAIKGSLDRLRKFNFMVPEGALRIRESDVLSPAELIRAHRQYRNRYLFGPSWRADIITAIQEGLTRPADIARRVGCSYEPAHRVAREYALAGKG